MRARSWGPLITEGDARRIETWVGEAVAGGAKVLCGGKRDGPFFEATYLENVDPRQKVSCQEVFGPARHVAALRFVQGSRWRSPTTAISACRPARSPRNIDHALYAYNELDVGGVVINDMPSFRVDSMPYGGVKNSGFGREGIRYSMEEMTELKLLVLNKLGRL